MLEATQSLRNISAGRTLKERTEFGSAKLLFCFRCWIGTGSQIIIALRKKTSLQTLSNRIFWVLEVIISLILKYLSFVARCPHAQVASVAGDSLAIQFMFIFPLKLI